MLMPKKSKYRKSHKGRRGGIATTKLSVSFGSYGLKALGAHWITARQIEAARRALTKYTKKTGKVWIRIFPDKPVTMKGGEIPMGKGKGSVDHYVCMIKPGTVMFEMDGIDEKSAKEAMNSAAYKLPIKCQFVKK
ncbi:50S ribosomal protein L16 [Candidatus Falkowbacteria bacterium CG_4_10_14_0_2_um_filter_41_15]|uniref:Large ribosomal subunit protein uL16 n=4 Tax=Candidatus Falkowiibacteriota TaxID=1752728 RepID=A0A2G9ZMA6_9BACT|nr:MAG: 50S ribosomal protein L16 [Candidatus Falkowbacteria bacterium CG1_02_41_21]PIP34292.1 MAG: 50S ribosomal protein L16 [Candidatus Falkowbacteria bacterium CG23_combo_of_CG06-09_8_20_14_all_41_10]PIZ10744.1 MAG: 50S ribosomal protein L16 [Candidatus Falkowbacteria bacterium CG_4_10_14_0_8_um_filter_41_36]PJA10075.1 MAG: 50S ribosomal protein L16 [Candidatus Falkowbacteria bacterium CG_4_10_14_0_2_um_filter_41_15]